METFSEALLFQNGFDVEYVVSKSGTISDVGFKRELANFYSEWPGTRSIES
jgi:hypothetical protein